MPEPTTTKRNILMVEDDQFVSTFLDARLKNNYATYLAPTTKAARELLAANSIDLILLDLMMPDESGFTFLGDIKKDEKYKAIPVIVISNFDQKEDISKAYQLGAVEYLVKANYTPAEIIGKIEAVLAGQVTPPPA